MPVRLHGARSDRLRRARAGLRRFLCGLTFLCLWALPPTGSPPGATAVYAQALRRPAAGAYDVVALRVAFQPDTTRFTTGDGTFEGDLFRGLSPRVDPLPHDGGYFAAHLSFLEDYVARVSDGRTTITTHLLPEVVQVSKPMGAYSPTGFDADGDEEMRKLAALVHEAWTRADAASAFDAAGLDPERTAFLLFHAGVGRDIELIGTTLDKTPLDLPSIFFDAGMLGRLLGGEMPTFKGLPVGHTMVVPRTETRRAFDFIQRQPFLAEFSINGMLAASFFNFLGVPDLFDTATGRSAIGPFGLMDPLGIFAYNGLFPPEPSAWTRYYLGWADPVEMEGAEPVVVPLAAVGLPGARSVARARISGAEYFLVENRHRDPEGDGLVLRVWKDGVVQEQRVANGQADFNSFDVSGFMGGVVVGVDQYDWALPGGLDENGNPLLGGMLVWHVDERRLAAGLAANSVNADPERRAIDLEEADGAQDLGFPQDNFFGPQADVGSPFDYFYAGNPVSVVLQSGREVRLYQNRFGPGTFPSSDANGGGPSFIVLDDFSAPGPNMTFRYARAPEDGITPLDVPVLPTGLLTAYGARFGAGSALGRWDAKAPTLVAFAAEAAREPGGLAVALTASPVGLGAAVMPAVGADGLLVTLDSHAEAAGGYALLAWTRAALDGPTPVAPTKHLLPAGVAGLDPVSPVVLRQEGDVSAAYVLFSGEGRGAVARAGRTIDVVPVADVGTPWSLAEAGGAGIVVAGTAGARVLGGGLAWDYTLSSDGPPGQVLFGSDRAGLVGVVPAPGEGALLWLLPGGTVRRVDAAQYAAGAADVLGARPVLVDLDADGRLDAVVPYGRRLLAFTQGGALVDGFPIALPAPSAAQPLVAMLTDSGGWSLIVAADDGYVHAFDTGRGGERVEGFPLAVGHRVAATPLLQDGVLYAVAADGVLAAWSLEGAGAVWWGRAYGDPANTGFVRLSATGPPETPDERLIVAEETYNWPNPVRDGQTYLRCRTTRDVRLEVTIVDPAGVLIDRFTVDHVPGGVPVEHRWTTSAESGVYFARLTAVAGDGRTDTHLVKIAIIR